MNVEIILDDPAGNSYVQVNPVSSFCFVSTFQRKLLREGDWGGVFHRALVVLSDLVPFYN